MVTEVTSEFMACIHAAVSNSARIQGWVTVAPSLLAPAIAQTNRAIIVSMNSQARERLSANAES
eukprot:5142880-Amphidinium_carterae.1